jgi:hypothetical protein
MQTLSKSRTDVAFAILGVCHYVVSRHSARVVMTTACAMARDGSSARVPTSHAPNSANATVRPTIASRTPVRSACRNSAPQVRIRLSSLRLRRSFPLWLKMDRLRWDRYHDDASRLVQMSNIRAVTMGMGPLFGTS